MAEGEGWEWKGAAAVCASEQAVLAAATLAGGHEGGLEAGGEGGRAVGEREEWEKRAKGAKEMSVGAKLRRLKMCLSTS